MTLVKKILRIAKHGVQSAIQLYFTSQWFSIYLCCRKYILTSFKYKVSL